MFVWKNWVINEFRIFCADQQNQKKCIRQCYREVLTLTSSRTIVYPSAPYHRTIQSLGVNRRHQLRRTAVSVDHCRLLMLVIDWHIPRKMMTVSGKKPMSLAHLLIVNFFTAHGSAASLLSGGSSLYGSAEERQLHEVRRLKRELVDARDQVMSLSSQLSTNVSTSCFY